MSQDDIETIRIQKLDWLPPVASHDELPIEGVADGTLCLVEGPATRGEEEVWQFTAGRWIKIDNL